MIEDNMYIIIFSYIFSAKKQWNIEKNKYFFYIFFSQEAVEYSKSFVTSVIIGKDVVPRIGLHQLEALRHDLVYAIHKSSDPKVCISYTINGVTLMEFHMLLHTRYRGTFNDYVGGPKIFIFVHVQG